MRALISSDPTQYNRNPALSSGLEIFQNLSSPWLGVVAETSVSTYRKDSSSVNVP